MADVGSVGVGGLGSSREVLALNVVNWLARNDFSKEMVSFSPYGMRVGRAEFRPKSGMHTTRSKISLENSIKRIKRNFGMYGISTK